jgi:hypothetical protein
MADAEVTPDPTLRIVEACDEPWLDAWAGLDRHMAQSVGAPLQQGLTAHREAVASVGLAGAPPEEWAERSDRLLEYRRVVGSALLEPLSAALVAPGPAELIRATFADALERSNAGARELPESVAALWPEGALVPHQADTRGRRIGKAIARAASPARHAGRERALPLRAVAVLHLGDDVAEAQGEAVVDAMAAWAEWSGRLERAWIAWADAALPALIRAELPDDDQGRGLWIAVRDAAARLQGSLEALAEEVPHARAVAVGQAMLDACRAALEADLAVAGSFLLTGREGPEATLDHVTKVYPALRAWDQEVSARLGLYVSLLAILAGAGAVQRQVVERCREGSLSGTGELLDVASKLRGLVPTLKAGAWGATLRARIAALDAAVTTALRPTLDAIPERPLVAANMSEVADSTVESLLAVIRQAPEGVTLHDAGASPPRGAKKVESRALPPQELARQSFDALRIERIRASTNGLVSAIGGVRGDLEGLPQVFAFARDEALRELDAAEPDCEERAVELLEGALERMASSLETRVQDLDKAVRGTQKRLASEIADGSSALVGRVGAGRMQSRLLAARSRAADLTAWVSDTWAPPVRRVLAAGQASWKRLLEWGAAALGKASQLLGREPTTTAASSQTVQSLADVAGLVEGLPLVYRRLFTLDPIIDSALLAGRDAQLEVAMARWRHWHTGEGVPLVVRGRQRNGITSFLRVLGSRIESEGHSYVSVSLDERATEEGALARLLSRKLGLARVDSLDALAHAIFAVPERSLPAAVTVDNLEHLYLRTPKGTDLAERFLTLISETEPRIFWIGGITSSSWQLVSVAEPTAVSQVDVMDLPPLTAEAVREAVLARHRRSGLDIHYEESVTRTARLRRRLRRMRDGKGLRQLLEDEFFEQLHRASGGYLGLALFLWLQSARFDEDEGVVMGLPSRPDFSVLDQLSLTQNFTLKAFLEHRTLTLAEHDRIFRLPRHESYQIFESLRNRQLIEEVARDRDADAEQSDIEVDLRYRVRPLFTGAVITHLQGRNIVH